MISGSRSKGPSVEEGRKSNPRQNQRLGPFASPVRDSGARFANIDNSPFPRVLLLPSGVKRPVMDTITSLFV